eukprot:11194268-Lingulodinium_polyedra.AAC.1
MANFGMALEMAADLTQHWWARAGTPTDQELQVGEAGAWPEQLHPDLAPLVPFAGATARQAFEMRLGATERTPTPQAEPARPLDARAWEPDAFTDGPARCSCPWAPWMRLAAFAVWAPG